MTLLAVTAARRAGPAELASARVLLRGASAAGRAGGALRWLLGYRCGDGRLAGVAGAERYGAAWLVRSVVVDPGFRGRGIAIALLAAVLGEARQLGVRDIFLLTTDAHDFFAARGFIVVARSAAPGALLASEELRGACSNTATLMQMEVAR